MECENLSKYYPIVMKFSGYLPFYEEASAIDFIWTRSVNPLSGTRTESGTKRIRLLQCEWDRNFQRCYRYDLFNNLVFAVSKMGHMSKSGTFPKCKVVLVLLFLFQFFRKKNVCVL